MPSRSNINFQTINNSWDSNLNRSYKPVNHFKALNRHNAKPNVNNELTDGEKAYLEKIMSDSTTVPNEEYAKLLEAKRLAEKKAFWTAYELARCFPDDNDIQAKYNEYRAKLDAEVKP